jgi:hypothetical protein
MLAALDLATGRLYYRIRPRERWCEFLSLLKTLHIPLARSEAVRSAEQLLPAQARQSPARTADNDVECVFLPIYGS